MDKKSTFSLVLVFLLLGPVGATERALVIGNKAYEIAPLTCPINDATDVAARLKQLGFTVALLTDADQQQMEDAIRSFADSIHSGDTALFYFSGHGAQWAGVNYLIPLGMNIQSQEEFRYKAVPAEMVLDKLERAGSRVNLIILDACRSNPFKRFKGLPSGLAQMNSPEGTLIAYATAPGTAALDGSRRNSVYTKHLLTEMKTPNLAVEQLFKQVRIKVVKETEGRQVPWESSSLMGEFCFASVGSRTVRPAIPPTRPAPPPTGPVQTMPEDYTNSIGMTLKLIPAGEFLMGSPEDEEDHDDDERLHRVRITKPFYLGVHEVTQEQYEQVMGENPSGFKGSTLPVDQVTWEEAMTFCAKLSKMDPDHDYRLPTEAEWEYACRAGSVTAYSFGDSESNLGDYAWFDKNSEKKTHPVGKKQPNDWGLYDMHGNVWEFCQDRYAEDYYATSPMDGPTGPATGSNRVYRGGSWRDYHAWYCRSAYRSFYSPGYRYIGLGFRVAQVPLE